MVNPYDILNYEIITIQRPNLVGLNLFYVAFNYIEAVLWFGIAIYVLFRYIRNRKTVYELLYALWIYETNRRMSLDSRQLWPQNNSVAA